MEGWGRGGAERPGGWYLSSREERMRFWTMTADMGAERRRGVPWALRKSEKTR